MKWVVSAPEKLNRFLQGQLDGHSGKAIRRLLDANLCRINGNAERFGSRNLKAGDRVELAPSFKSILRSKPIQFETLFENDSLRIVNKPKGFICSKENALKAFGPNCFLAHRLDKDTTGLLILAKGAKAREELLGLFKERKIKKSYLALVDGCVLEKEGRRESLLIKKGSYDGQTIWGSSLYQGLTAITTFKRLLVGKEASLLLCEPFTGRTHQIRVHMAEMGHPILVDPQYARSYRSKLFSSRPLLHAYRLEFSFHGKTIEITAPIPTDMREAFSNLLIEIPLEMGSFC